MSFFFIMFILFLNLQNNISGKQDSCFLDMEIDNSKFSKLHIFFLDYYSLEFILDYYTLLWVKIKFEFLE